MGLFRKDWSAEIDRAESLLRDGKLVRSLEVARRAAAKTDGGLALRAATVADRARRALLESVLANAARAEGEGNLADAADWLLAALEHEEDTGRRGELEARRAALLERLDREEGAFIESSGEISTGGGAIDHESHYQMLVDTVSEALRPRYDDRPREFRQALVHLNEGRAAEALELLVPLVERSPGDPVLRLESGRAHLLAGKAREARRDLEMAWRELGEAPIDLVDTLSIPALWAEASLAEGAAEEVAAKLEALADPVAGTPLVCRLYAESLIAAGRLEGARRYLEAAAPRMPEEPELGHLLARLLADGGELDRAIAGLERAVAPSCRTGSCAAPAPHPPSLRTLARLHIARGRDLDRARELMAIITSSRRGHLEAEDYAVLEALFRASGDVEAAETAAGEARRLAELGEHAASPAPTLLGSGRERVL